MATSARRCRGEDPRSEFGQLAAAYNDMAAALARREDDLREHADALEARVAERTQELLVTNNRLQVEIAERQNTEAALVQSQKLQVVGQLAGGIAHDFNNLLATIQGSLDLLSRTVPPEEERQRTWIERATGAVHRGSQLTGRLLAFSRRQRLAVQASDVNKLMSDLVPLLRTCTHGQRIRIDTWLGGDLWPAMVEPSQVEAAILNLALNARDAMPDGGVLTITTANQPVTDAMKGRYRGRRLRGDHRHRQRRRHDGRSGAARVRAVLHHEGAVGQWAGAEPGVRHGARIRWHGAAGDVT